MSAYCTKTRVTPCCCCCTRTDGGVVTVLGVSGFAFDVATHAFTDFGAVADNGAAAVAAAAADFDPEPNLVAAGAAHELLFVGACACSAATVGLRCLAATLSATPALTLRFSASARPILRQSHPQTNTAHLAFETRRRETALALALQNEQPMPRSLPSRRCCRSSPRSTRRAPPAVVAWRRAHSSGLG
jgi:hypothetical protein